MRSLHIAFHLGARSPTMDRELRRRGLSLLAVWISRGRSLTTSCLGGQAASFRGQEAGGTSREADDDRGQDTNQSDWNHRQVEMDGATGIAYVELYPDEAHVSAVVFAIRSERYFTRREIMGRCIVLNDRNRNRSREIARRWAFTVSRSCAPAPKCPTRMAKQRIFWAHAAKHGFARSSESSEHSC